MLLLLAVMLWLKLFMPVYLIGIHVVWMQNWNVVLIVHCLGWQILFLCCFNRLVDKINMSVGQDINSKIQIGVLDIYGFECFKDNRYVGFQLFVIYRSSFPLLGIYGLWNVRRTEQERNDLVWRPRYSWNFSQTSSEWVDPRTWERTDLETVQWSQTSNSWSWTSHASYSGLRQLIRQPLRWENQWNDVIKEKLL